MARSPRLVEDDGIYHVLNRRAGQATLFESEPDYGAFEKALDEAAAAVPMRVLAYCLMPNHWHLLLWPRKGRAMSAFIQRLTLTHMRRWHSRHGTTGTGPVYQGRFKSFPVQDDAHLLTVARYVERNALRAKLARRAEQWRWCSLWQRQQEQLPAWLVPARDWPVELPPNWSSLVNKPQTDAELEAVRLSVKRGVPLGSEAWQRRTAARLKLQSTLRDPWRPKRQ